MNTPATDRMAAARAAKQAKAAERTAQASTAAAAPAISARKPLKMRARPNWDDMTPVDDVPDRLRIPPDMVAKLERDHGMSLQWVTDSVYGKPEPQLRASQEKRGWTPVHAEDFDGMFDGMFTPKGSDGEINMEGLVLMARPVEITRAAQARDRRAAKVPTQIREQQLRGGDLPGVSGANHPTVRNSINRTRERIEIPNDAE